MWKNMPSNRSSTICICIYVAKTRNFPFWDTSSLSSEDLANSRTGVIGHVPGYCAPRYCFGVPTSKAMSHPYARRLLKEYQALSSNPLEGIRILPDSVMDHYQFEIITDNPHYKDQKHLLDISVVSGYPVDSPLVKFLQEKDYVIPIHPHIYSNGHICLNLLGKDWTPACGIETILLSLQSMLNHNDVLKWPIDNDRYVVRAPKDPKKTNFRYHDDNV